MLPSRLPLGSNPRPNPMNTRTEYVLSEPQAVAILAALKLLDSGKVAQMLPDTRGELSQAYHRLNGALSRNLYGPHTNAETGRMAFLKGGLI